MKDLGLKRAQKKPWHWTWKLGTSPASAQLNSDGAEVRVELCATNLTELAQAWSDLHKQSASHKLTLRMDSQSVLINDHTTLSGDEFRSTLKQVAEEMGTDCGLTILATGLGQAWIPIGNWPQWRRSWDQSAVLTLSITDYAEKAKHYAHLDAWMQSFQRQASSQPGWIAGVGMTNSTVSKTLLARQKKRWESLARIGWWGWTLCAVLVIALGVFGYLHSAKPHIAQVEKSDSSLSDSADAFEQLAAHIAEWQQLRDSLQTTDLHHPPGFGMEPALKHLDSLEANWNSTWRVGALHTLLEQMRTCEEPYCEIVQESRKVLWLWISGMGKPSQALVKHALGTLYAKDEETPWSDAWDTWVEKAQWSHNASSADSLHVELWCKQASLLQRTLQSFVQDRSDSLTVNADSLHLPHSSLAQLQLTRFALPEAQAGVEDLFALDLDSNAQTRFRDLVRQRQWEQWQNAFAQWMHSFDSPTPARVDSLRKAWSHVRDTLGIKASSPDSLQLDSLLTPVRTQFFHEHLRKGLAPMWPLVCDPQAVDADPMELKRQYGPKGELQQWMDSNAIHEPAGNALERWRGTLFTAEGWKAHQLSWKVCSARSWDIQIQLDSLAVHLDGQRDTCVQGVVEWPKHLQQIRMSAQHGAAHWEYQAQGIFALSRWITEQGKWSAGQGLQMAIPLRAKDFQSTLRWQWQEQGEDARAVQPCGLALPLEEIK